jgi:hypothetical protein
MSEEAHYVVNHRATDLKLAIYALLNLIGAGTAAYGYFVRPWERVRLLVGIGAATYLALMGVWMFLSSFIITTTIFRGKRRDASQKERELWLKSECNLPDAVYRTKAIDPVTGKEFEESVGEIEVYKCIDRNGKILGAKFCDFMSQVLDKIPSVIRSD